MTRPPNNVGVLFAGPQLNFLSNYGKIQPLSTLVFLQAGSAGPTQQPQVCYQDGQLTSQFSPTGVVTADANGRFPPIWLNPITLIGTLRVQMFNAAGQLLLDVDPYTPQPSLFFAHQVKAVATSRTNISAGGSLTPDPELLTFIAGPGIYYYDCLLEISTAGSSGADPGFRVFPTFKGAFLDNDSAGLLLIGNMVDINTGKQGTTNNMNFDASGGIGTGGILYDLTGGNAINTLNVRGQFAAMSAGTFTINWGQATTDAGQPVTMHAGSHFNTRQLS
jgi:hypothetical protein